MFWLPIVFACLISGECSNVAFPSYVSDKQCITAAKGIARQLEENPLVVQYHISCIPIYPPEV